MNNKTKKTILSKIKNKIKKTLNIYTKDEKIKLKEIENKTINELMNYLQENKLNETDKDFISLLNKYKYFVKTNKLISQQNNIIFIKNIDNYIKNIKDNDKYNIVIKKIKQMKKNYNLIIFNGKYTSINKYGNNHIFIDGKILDRILWQVQ